MDSVLPTTHADVSVRDTGGEGISVLFLHGNSSCKEVFQDQLDGLKSWCRCIALDLPGHGASSDARQPETTYTMAGYADCAIEVLDQLGIDQCVLVGWSLGGHIGIEMLAKTKAVKGLVISGTPPMGKNPEVAKHAFLPNPHMSAAGTETLSPEELEAYARATCGEKRYEPFLLDAVKRTDGRARRIMVQAALEGAGVNQREIVEASKVPIAVINGADEALVNNEYIKEVAFANLWRQQVILVEAAGHAPFWDQPDAFSSLLGDFLVEAI